MKVSGFTIVRNAVNFDYPVREAILSVLPLCDEFIVLVGNSEDTTTGLIQSISPRLTIHHSVWDDTLREGGKVLAVETNKAFDKVSADSDWAFYIQADEVLHERYHETVRNAMLQHRENQEVQGLLFDYTHFYGNYSYVGASRQWYRHEIRIIRNDKQIRSFKDAQGFRRNDKKLQVKKVKASIYHYGWVKHPAQQKEKEKSFHKLWHDDDWMQTHVKDEPEFDYSTIDSLVPFTETHPAVMKERIARLNWDFKYDPKRNKTRLKYRLLNWFERKTGIRLFEYRNYRII